MRDADHPGRVRVGSCDDLPSAAIATAATPSVAKAVGVAGHQVLGSATQDVAGRGQRPGALTTVPGRRAHRRRAGRERGGQHHNQQEGAHAAHPATHTVPVIPPTGAPSVQSDALLEDDPINPAWILEGQPKARCTIWAESADRTTANWVWDCTSGSFRWYYDLDETIVVIDGAATIQVDGQEPVTLGVGDAAYYPAGTWATWTIDTYVRKQAVVRVPVPRAMAYAVNGFGRRTHRLR